MIALVPLVSGSFALAFMLFVVSLLVLVLFASRRRTHASDFHPCHKGKADTHTCKFDRSEVERTKLRLKPPVNLPPAKAVNAKVATTLANVDAAVVLQALRGLSGEISVTVGGRSMPIRSRSSLGKDIDVAMSYLEQFYGGLGLKAIRDPYKVRGKTYYNLVVEIVGKTSPDNVVIVGAHLDSTAGDTWRAEPVAPGADDDGSGTVALMELARALSKMTLGCTVRLVHFTGEEQGLWGSYAYSDKVAAAGTKVVAMIQMDMIGYCAKPGNRLDVHDGADRNGSHSLVALFTGNAKRYGLAISPYDTHNHAVDDRSDHAGFHDHGYKAVCLSEEFTDDGFNPNYHSTGDRVGALNIPFMVEAIRLAIACVADLAEVAP